ncbi:MAG: MarR family transcriptional regulator [Candidatus Aminicenantes bacterium]|nr:MarR family transcriptional regulator [Candidatus Aminicenantes bacterium]
MLFEETLMGHMIELVWRIYFFSRRAFDLDLKKVKLTYPQFGALRALNIKENISQKQLAAMLETDTTNVMVVCDSLEKKKLIKRTSNPSDRRENLLVMTEKGKARFKKAMYSMEAYTGKIVGQLSKKELSVVIPILEKLYQSIKRSAE